MLLGKSLIWFSLIATGLAMLAYMPGIRKTGSTKYLGLARLAAIGSAVGLLSSTGYLWYLILTHQFQFTYVFRYSSTDMPLRYVISSLWGGQEGTFLMWAAYCGILAVFLRFKSRQYEQPVMFFYMGITFFLLLMLTKASPFATFDTRPAEGNGLNPLLQDPWMTIHPPIMFFGFASLGIPAAYAMAALVKEDWDNWVPRAIPWTIFGVLALGVGLTLGGYWSYSILGWGGYWGWDPVENSSLVPWLLGVTLLHTQVIQMRRGFFRKANLVLSILPFLLVTYSTFLTRSGVLADFSVHSFTDLGINQFLVAFMVVFLSGGLFLYVWKFRRIPGGGESSPLMSREYVMFLGALAFALFGAFVCLGTSAPLISRLWGNPSNVEPEFYNRVGLPFIALVSILMAFAPYLVWQRAHLSGIAKKMWIALAATAVLTPIYAFLGVHNPAHLVMSAAGTLVLVANLQITLQIMRRRWSAAGGYLTHVGIGFMVLGILASTAYDRMQVIELPKDQEVPIFGYTLKYTGSRPVEDGRKNAYDIQLSKGTSASVMSPTMYYSDFNGGMMKKPAIKSFLTHDVYVAPGGLEVEPVDGRVKTSVVLAKKTPQSVGGMVVTFDGFDMGDVDMSGDAMASGGHAGAQITAVLQVQRGGETTEMRPRLDMSDGHRHPIPEAIPGTDMTLSLDGIDATNGRVQIGIGAPPLVLSPHESGEIGGFQVHLKGFDVDQGSGRGNKVAIYALTEVTANGNTYELKPGFVNRANMDREYVETPIGDTGMNLVFYDVNTDTRQAQFYVARPPAEMLWVEASTKPFILFLWLGTGLVVIGLLIATIFRGRLAGQLARRLGDTARHVNGKKVAA